ncbi:MAG TPA: solute:sodium symporter family transporter [Saprospiraceae bacterium]|nr:solute:sodium symporter family transporter [Saprospiraceae bacterium]
MIQFISFLFFTSLVAFWGFWKLRNEKLNTSDGYFLGGRSLTGIVIAGSMLLTNISTEHLLGMNGSAYKNGAIIIAWEVTSALALIVAAFYFLPRYLSMGLTTIPEFIEKRFDGVTRAMMACILILSFVFTILPIVLYTGALSLENIFGLSEALSISKSEAIVLSVWGVGGLGGMYAIYGGLKMVAHTDMINGMGLMIAGLAIPVIALYDIGQGNILSGMGEIYRFNPEKFSTVSLEKSVGPGSREAILPFSVLFTGLIINQVYFWAMHQSIIQRALGAVSLKEAQKGLLLTGLLKILIPFVIVLPGIIGFYYFGTQYYDDPDQVYPQLVKKLLPSWASGFFLAVIIGAIFSTFNSALNSAATIFSLDIYKRFLSSNATERKVVSTGKFLSLFLALGAIIIAPAIAKAPDGLYQLLQQLNGIFFVPMATIIIAGFFMPWITAKAARAGLVFGLVFYILFYYIFKVNIHFVHLWGLEFISNIGFMTLISLPASHPSSFTVKNIEVVPTSPWRWAWPFSWFLIIIVLSIYIFTTIIS